MLLRSRPRGEIDRGASLTPPPQRSLPARPGCRAGGLQLRTPSGKGSCLFRRRPAATPKRRQRLSAARGHLRRSEEHTSELQSQFHLVCRLLLEKKKNAK